MTALVKVPDISMDANFFSQNPLMIYPSAMIHESL
jgi:hypothetical protein